jgi:homoserine kinase type II
LAQYTHLTKQDIEEIARPYGLLVSSYDSIAGGAENSSYQLETDKGPMVLTLFETKTMREAERLGELLKHLAAQNFHSHRVVEMADGALIGEHERKAVMLKHYLKGEVLAVLSERMVRQLGTQMALLHAIPAPNYLPDEPAFGLKRIRLGLAEVRDDSFKEWLDQRIEQLEQRMGNKLPNGLVHADLFNDNVLFRDEELVALIDFEDAGHTVLVYDIGMAIVGTCLQGTNVDWEKARALVRGYESLRNLEAQERNSLQASIEYGALSTAYWRYWKYNIEQPTPERADKHLEMRAVAEGVGLINARNFRTSIF